MEQHFDENDIRERILQRIAEQQTENIGAQQHEIITLLWTCILAMQHATLYGSFGLNKSRLVRGTLDSVRNAMSFMGGCSRFMTKEDLVGPIKMTALKEDKFIRETTGRLPEAHFGFLDEGLEMNDPLVLELHSIANEREFSNGGVAVKTPTMSIFIATNISPEEAMQGKPAFMDRIMVRVKVEPPKSKADLIAIRKLNRDNRLSSKEITQVDIEEIKFVQQKVLQINVPRHVDETIYKVNTSLSREGVFNSLRRLTALDTLLQASAWLRGDTEVENIDLSILKYVLWHKEEDRKFVIKTLGKEAKSQLTQSDELSSDVTKILARFENLKPGDSQRAKLISQVGEKLLKLSDLIDEYEVMNKDATKIAETYSKVNKIHQGMIRER